jgi:Glycine zipper 2TM domain
MTKSSTFAKGALAAAAGLAALCGAAAASAQPGPGYSNYDPCQRDANNRGLTGALVGGAGGAVLGSQFSASGHRSDGSLLGGVVGAIAGAAIGHSSAACNGAPPPPSYRDAPPPPPPPPQAYYQPEPRPYGEAYYAPPPVYEERDTVWAYGHHGLRLRVMEDRMGPDGCSLAESPVYMPDGRVDRRFVRVCPDARGRYHIVD